MAQHADASREEADPPFNTTPQWQHTKRGKGRVAPRASAPPGASLPVPKLTAVSHSDALHGEQAGDPAPRYGPGLVSGWVPYVTMNTPQAVYAALSAIYDGRPVLLREAPFAAPLIAKKWNFAALAAAAPQPPASGPRTEDEVEVWCSDAQRHRFFECDDAKNDAAGPYHLREPETQRLRMTVPEFVQCAARWRTRRVMLKATVLAADGKGGLAPTGGALAGPAATLKAGLDWEWLDRLRRSQGFGPVLRVDLEAGTTGGLLPARYSTRDEMLAQAAGRRRVLLFPPDAAFEGMYPFPVAHPYDRYSMVDLEALDPGRWPGCGRQRGLVAVLRPGDILHIPAHWFAHEQDLEPESATLRVTLHPGTRAPAADTAPLRAARVVEERVAAVVGPSAVRRWVSLIGAGREAEALDLGTVAGYRRAVMAQGVRDEVEEAVGTGSWATLLPSMCSGRLTPTPWLNVDFRDPWLLSDVPVVVGDDRTEEERRFPQLFRRRLEDRGWSVPASVSTVPIPGVNVPAAVPAPRG